MRENCTLGLTILSAGWKNDEAVFLPFPPTLEIDQADFHIPTVTTTTTR
jgi:hypothetical protein